MAVSDSQYQALLARLRKLETTMNDVLIAIERFATLNQVQQLLTITQAELQSLGQDVDALEQRVEAIENDPTG